ncbi:MAG: 2-oxoacid:ferredoxin oxidoreductase subunit beta [Fibrobacterota bacterium]|nr:2-oxoacid:ferredoxin oxidoreductase subunit beta [Fibrobacterota bacterium]QQS04722.1 MAG: 2-oxoacid:ferredoxin oxidoreductase subunit beta [Fibrobacterota bacterium]
MIETTSAPVPLTKKDFVSDVQVKWCPGCGDYSILAALQSVMPKLGIPKENFAIISGIGCSSRFPYYMNTYGFHTIHGRAMAVATGVKAANPDLQVWVITGDGDGLSIGGNHLLHTLRRNVDLKVILFNNEIYGLTKGQYSPTSNLGLKTKTSPMGSVERPLSPVSIALAAGAGFVARTVDNDIKHLSATLEAAAKFKGTAFVEVLQNCVIFNDATHAGFAAPDVRKEKVLYLEDGKPLTYAEGRKGLFAKGYAIDARDIGESEAEQVLMHSVTEETGTLAWTLSQFDFPEKPVPLGVFRAVERPTFNELMDSQMAEARAKKGNGDLNKLLHSGFTWKID